MTTNNYIVYKHTCPNGKVYIGISGQTPIKRFRNGRGYHHNSHFTNAIAKYGWSNIKHEVLYDNLTKEEAEQKEVELIAYYKSNQRKLGYNLSVGGESGRLGAKHSEETKQRLRELNKGNKPFLGKRHTEETKEKMRMAKIGEKQTEETKQKRSVSLKGHIVTDETRAKISNSKTNKKPVLCVELNNIYESVAMASRAINRATGHIRQCCNGERNTCGGYHWEWA